MSRSRMVLGGLAAVLLLSVAFLWWAVPDRQLDPTGPHAIATESWVLLDEGRPDRLADEAADRRIPVQAWYPARAPRGPVVVFVHGTQGRRLAYLTWIRELASHGYTVVAADHPPVALFPAFPDGSSAPSSSSWSSLMGEASDPTSFVEHPVFQLAHEVVAADLTAMLDDLPVRLGVSTARVVLAGHSFGGGLAVTHCDDEPRCVGMIDLDGPPFGDRDLPAVRKPLLVFLAGRTRMAAALDAVWQPIDPMIANAAGPIWVYALPSAGHLDLSDLGLLVRPSVLRTVFPTSQIGPGSLDEKLRAVAAVSVAFVDRTLAAEDVDIQAVADAYPRLERR
ncbi:MAG: dienelactone hydrolase family protein [Myxococcota bacterium]